VTLGWSALTSMARQPTGEVSPDKGLVFHWSEKDYLKQFEHDRSSNSPSLKLTTNMSDIRAEAFDPDHGGDWAMPGGMISLSANGNRDGILWITLPKQKGGGRLLAYNAMSLVRLWDTGTTLCNPLTKFNPPTVADGRVLIGTQTGDLLVYGLPQRGVTPPQYGPCG
jgi:hypothetical protein